MLERCATTVGLEGPEADVSVGAIAAMRRRVRGAGVALLGLGLLLAAARFQSNCESGRAAGPAPFLMRSSAGEQLAPSFATEAMVDVATAGRASLASVPVPTRWSGPEGTLLEARVADQAVPFTLRREREGWQGEVALPPLDSGTHTVTFSDRPWSGPALEDVRRGDVFTVRGGGGPVALLPDGTVEVVGYTLRAPRASPGDRWCRLGASPLRQDWLFGEETPKLGRSDGFAVRVLLDGSVAVTWLVRGAGTASLILTGPEEPARPQRVALGLLAPSKAPASPPRDWTWGERSVEIWAPGGTPPHGVNASARSLEIALLPSNAALGFGDGRLLRTTLSSSEPRTSRRPLLLPTGIPRAGRSPPWRAALEATGDRLLRPDRGGILLEGALAGDCWFSPTEEGNLEYDTILGLSSRAVRGRLPRAHFCAQAATDHLISRDWDAEGSGLFFPHANEPRRERPEPGHHWIEGWLGAVAREQDPLLGQIGETLCRRALPALLAVRVGRSPPRDVVWAIETLAIGAHTDRAQREGLRRLVDGVLAARVPKGPVRLAAPESDGAARRQPVSPFLQGGILVPALARAGDVLGDARVRQAAREIARFVASAGTVVDEQDRIRFPARWLLESPERAAVFAAQGTCPGEMAALVVAGLFRADPECLVTAPIRAVLASLPATLVPPEKVHSARESSLALRALHILPAR